METKSETTFNVAVQANDNGQAIESFCKDLYIVTKLLL
jgi:hypothetical protein